MDSRPDTAATLTQRAEAYYAQGNLSEALAACHQAIQQQPDWALAYVTMGNIQQAQDQVEAAIRSYQKALELNPNLPQAHVNLGSMYYKQGDVDQAINCYQQAISLKPDFAAAYWNLAQTFRKKGQTQQAHRAAQKAMELQPQNRGAKTFFDQGNQLAAAGKLEEAMAAWKHTVHLDPKFAEAYCQMGIIERHRGNIKQAASWLEKSLEIKPDLIPAYQNLCAIFRDTLSLKSARQAVDQYRQVCGLNDPIMTAIYWMSIHQVSGLNHRVLEQFLALESQLPTLIQQGSILALKSLYTNLLFIQPYLRDDPEKNYQLQQQITAEYIQKVLLPNPSQTLAKNWSLDSSSAPLKIGIISSHFNRHSVGWCSADIIQALAQLPTEIYLYFTEKPRRDDRTQLFEEVAHKVYQPQSYPDGLPDVHEIIQAIQKDNINILLDLDSITVPNHAEILYHQPAPICLSWLGFDSPQISDQNYFLCDQNTHPSGQEKLNTEQLLRMPDSFVAVNGFERVEVEGIQLRKAYRIGADQVIYLCVSPGRKFNPELVQAQVKILKAVPNSILIHKGMGDPEVFQSAYWQACEMMAISPHRVKLMERFPSEEEHRQIYAIADVLLDSYPYNGGTHTLEALWFNVPVVTRKGSQFLSRMGYSFLQAVGIDTGIAESWQEYTNWGIELGHNQGLRQSLKTQLIQSKTPEQLSPLWNPTQFAQNLYSILEQLYRIKIESV